MPRHPFERLHRLLSEAGARRMAPELPVYELAVPWWPFSKRARRFENLRIEILETALALSGPGFLASDEALDDYDVGGVWSQVVRDTWQVPDGVDLRALLHGPLRLGGWTLYTGAHPVTLEKLPDAFAISAIELADFATSHAIPFFLQAFQDDDPWRLFVELGSGEQQLAA